MVSSETDRELQVLAEQEAQACSARLQEAEAVIRDMFVPRDPDDVMNVILEVRAGTGGLEASLFAGEMFEMYNRYVALNFKPSVCRSNRIVLGNRYAVRKGWRFETLEVSKSDAGGLREASAAIAGRVRMSRAAPRQVADRDMG
jgi:peptide chain release factor 1